MNTRSILFITALLSSTLHAEVPHSSYLTEQGILESSTTPKSAILTASDDALATTQVYKNLHPQIIPPSPTSLSIDQPQSPRNSKALISFQSKMDLGYIGPNESRAAAELHAPGNNVFLLQVTKSLLEVIAHH